jgi:hypothetical protein
MTQQFKFGDRVRCKQTGAEGLIIDTGKTAAWIIWEGQKCSNFYAYGTFEPILHPDTARLDWLADPANKIGSVILPTECVEQHLDSMRDAIDAAMRIQEATHFRKSK